MRWPWSRRDDGPDDAARPAPVEVSRPTWSEVPRMPLATPSIQRAADVDAFTSSSFTSWRDPSVLRPLDHAVDTSASIGLVHGLTPPVDEPAPSVVPVPPSGGPEPTPPAVRLTSHPLPTAQRAVLAAAPEPLAPRVSPAVTTSEATTPQQPAELGRLLGEAGPARPLPVPAPPDRAAVVADQTGPVQRHADAGPGAVRGTSPLASSPEPPSLRAPSVDLPPVEPATEVLGPTATDIIESTDLGPAPTTRPTIGPPPLAAPTPAPLPDAPAEPIVQRRAGLGPALTERPAPGTGPVAPTPPAPQAIDPTTAGEPAPPAPDLRAPVLGTVEPPTVLSARLPADREPESMTPATVVVLDPPPAPGPTSSLLGDRPVTAQRAVEQARPVAVDPTTVPAATMATSTSGDAAPLIHPIVASSASPPVSRLVAAAPPGGTGPSGPGGIRPEDPRPAVGRPTPSSAGLPSGVQRLADGSLVAQAAIDRGLLEGTTVLLPAPGSAPEPAPAAPAGDGPARPVQRDATEPADATAPVLPPEPAPVPAAASPAPAPPGPAQLDELAKQLYGRIRTQLAAELLSDRERSGLGVGAMR